MYQKVYLSNIEWEFGQKTPVSDLTIKNLDPEGRTDKSVFAELELIKQWPEFEFYLHARNISAFTMAERAIEKTLNRCGLDPNDIDMIVYASECFPLVLDRKPFHLSVKGKLGLKDHYPITVSNSECANFIVALEVAANYIELGKANNVLLVSSDMAGELSSETRPGNGLSRVANSSILSDAATCCLISSKPKNGVRVLDIDKAYSHNDPHDLSWEKVLFQFIQNNSGLVKNMLDKHSLMPSDIKHVFTYNMSKRIMSIMFSQSGIKPTQIHMGNIPEFAHISADALVNLKDYAQQQGLNKGEHYLLHGTGILGRACALVESLDNATEL